MTDIEKLLHPAELSGRHRFFANMGAKILRRFLPRALADKVLICAPAAAAVTSTAPRTAASAASTATSTAARKVAKDGATKVN